MRFIPTSDFISLWLPKNMPPNLKIKLPPRRDAHFSTLPLLNFLAILLPKTPQNEAQIRCNFFKIALLHVTPFLVSFFDVFRLI